ncbi:HlyD family type I secretion periplasmic adaptor subunit [Pseudoalteromonas sp. L23]|uniref:HlyD family type I secretion periplasmic adaptor subunit n=1 Tax=unclassified Pseudoalteromonas TaxID=194690 RepID=UPI001F1D8A0D|nr:MULTISPECIES: HlyD family type I secretion periplasmic adaptor subunit [unclassified Pseudoalteromonas]MCF2825737.1 HlyD family type I secretion periplasmic adaptor subunit [Pseudoalteromonas sp. OF5H-5]MCF2831035.1 HlyD family type I secretion periplasmic adaptor subunit [Pseudoalteromonas sp. DL2-H6]MCF2923703.1 HlyD family type I secretion periplasmic adaptor subunit [Pseudoalteromonas sp. DL2-H1]MCF7513795.1 HlyD family type I secretion periplasmic adaptor subunit [Pseudoalteromonas sp. 
MSRKQDTRLYEFLAPALEIEAAPPPQGARAIVWTLLVCIIIAIAWAYIGRVDIVAVAQGQLIPKQKVKVIQPLETAVVRGIHVHEGQRVEQGQLLVSFDPAITESNFQRIRLSTQDFSQQIRRKQLLIARLNQIKPSSTGLLNPAQQALLEAELAEYRSERASLSSQLLRFEAELAGARAKLTQLDKVLPLVEERAQALEQLQVNKLVSREEYLEIKQTAIHNREQRHIELATIETLQATIKATRQEQETLKATLIRTAQAELNQLEQELVNAQQELAKSQYLLNQNKLYAPVSGTVEALALSTLGEVVTPAQQLLTIVPAEDELIVEARLLNKDIGFTYQGQIVEVKIDSFPFTRYGIIEGEVLDVSTDAVEDEQLGLYFPVKVAINQQTIQIDGRVVPLSAGMSVSAEVKTGQRRIIEFLLSPVVQHLDEGARER